jgi:hypothetical protein
VSGGVHAGPRACMCDCVCKKGGRGGGKGEDRRERAGADVKGRHVHDNIL